MPPADPKDSKTALSPDDAEEMVRFGITRVAVDYFHCGAWHCHVNRRWLQKTAWMPFQVAALALSHSSNASVRNRLNRDLLSK